MQVAIEVTNENLTNWLIWSGPLRCWIARLGHLANANSH